MPTHQDPVLRVDGPVVLDWGDGVRLQISPVGAVSRPAATPSPHATARAGRKPSPATQAVIDAMHADKAAGRQRTRQEYLEVLRSAGHEGSDQSAGLILAREAKRVFGHTLGRTSQAQTATKQAQKTSGGRRLSREAQLIRDRLEDDSERGALGDANHYARWLVKQPKVKMGLKPAKALIYREMRRLK